MSIQAETHALFKEPKLCACGKVHLEAWGQTNKMGHFWFDCSNCHSCLMILKNFWAEVLKK